MLTGMTLLALLVGIAVGVAAGWFGFPQIREARRLRTELEERTRELEEYRLSVGAHFRKTAELVTQMTKSYAAVYDHLSDGARTFCDATDASTQVPFEPLPGALASPEIETEAVQPAATVAQAQDEAGPETAAAEMDGTDDFASDSSLESGAAAELSGAGSDAGRPGDRTAA